MTSKHPGGRPKKELTMEALGFLLTCQAEGLGAILTSRGISDLDYPYAVEGVAIKYGRVGKDLVREWRNRLDHEASS